MQSTNPAKRLIGLVTPEAPKITVPFFTCVYFCDVTPVFTPEYTQVLFWIPTFSTACPFLAGKVKLSASPPALSLAYSPNFRTITIGSTLPGGIIMPFDPNDYPLGKEHQARLMRQAHQDHLAEEVRTNSIRKAVTNHKRMTLAAVAVVLATISFVIVLNAPV
jgi:hypothetical protein